MASATHILFDFFGTLVSCSSSWVDQGYGHTFGLLRARGAEVSYQDFVSGWDGLCGEWELEAERTGVEFRMDELCRAFLRGVLPEVPGPEVVSEFRETYMGEWNSRVKYIPGVPELLSDLAEKFTLALVTNTHQPDLVRDHLRSMNIASSFVSVVTSIEHGRRKPCPTIFDEALRRSAGSPERSVYVGDSYRADYLGAAAARMRCLLIDPHHRYEVPETDRLEHILELSKTVMW